jgi:hypothetical protein
MMAGRDNSPIILQMTHAKPTMAKSGWHHILMHLLSNRLFNKDRTMNRTSTIVVTALAVTLVAGITGSVWWWKTHSAEIIDSAKGAYEEGQKAGSKTDEEGCLASAVERQKMPDNQGVLASTRSGISLSACLRFAKPSAKFCENVPSAKNALDASLWAIKTCSQHNITDRHCQSVMQQVIHYCGSPTQMKKAGKSVGRALDENAPK